MTELECHISTHSVNTKIHIPNSVINKKIEINNSNNMFSLKIILLHFFPLRIYPTRILESNDWGSPVSCNSFIPND